MSYTYNYVRNKSGGLYDLENTITMDGDIVISNSPSDEIKTSLPGKNFKLFGDDENFNCVFNVELNTSEESSLDTIVANARKF